MKCPHCQVAFHLNYKRVMTYQDVDGFWIIDSLECPECERLILVLTCTDDNNEQILQRFAHPKVATRAPCPTDVPNEIAEDYNEACLVLSEDPVHPEKSVH